MARGLWKNVDGAACSNTIYTEGEAEEKAVSYDTAFSSASPSIVVSVACSKDKCLM